MFKTTKAKIIFVAIFSIICIITTIMLVWYKNIEIEEVQEIEIVEEISNETQDDIPGIDLKGNYNQNDLLIKEMAVTKEKVEIRYFQISGLKNKNIENKINKEIEQIALNWYKEEIKNLDEVINVYVSMWNSANFGNTVSFELNYVAKIDDDDDGFYQGIRGLNYDLNTGEKITIDKMFTSDVPIKNIMRQSIYYGLLENKVKDNLAGDLIVSNYGNIEDEVAQIMNLYKKGKIVEFSYTPMQINMYYKNKQITSINMEKFAKYIAIYNRYLSDETIFENDNIGIKNLYTLTNRYSGIYYYEKYEKADNYFIDITIDLQSVENDEFAKKIADDKIKVIEKEIKKVKQKVSENQNQFYILNYYVSIYTGKEELTQQILTSCNEYGNTYQMTPDNFKQNIEPMIIKYNKEDNGGGIPNYVYNFEEILNVKPQTTMEYYDPQTEEKIVI